MNVQVKKGILWAVLVGLTAWAIHSCPARAVKHLGGLFSPKGEISDVFVPVFHRALVILGAAFSSMALGAFLWRHSLFAALAGIIRKSFGELRSVLRSMLWHLRQLSTAERVAMMLILVIGVGIRLWYLNQPMRFDEATTVLQFAGSPWYIAMANYSAPNNHILNTLLVKMAIAIGGNREWVVRLPALSAGLLCLPLVYLYARLMYSRPGAMMALAWLAVSPPFVDMSTNARGYTMVVACGLISHIAAYYILHRGYLTAAVLNAVAIGFGLIAVPVAVLFVASSVIWMGCLACSLCRQRQWRAPRGWLGAGSVCLGLLLAMAGYLPMLVIMGPKWLVANDWVRPLAWGAFIQSLPSALLDFARYNIDHLPGIMAAGFGICMIYYLVFWRRIERTGISIPLVISAVSFCFLLANRRYPLWGLAPMWMFLSAVAAGAASAGFADMLSRWGKEDTVNIMTIGAALGLAATGAKTQLQANLHQTMSSDFGYALNSVPQTVQYLAEQATLDDHIVMDNAFAVHHYYAHRLKAPPLNWSREGDHPRRIFVLQTTSPNPIFDGKMWRHLSRYGVSSTNDMRLAATYSDHSVWVADLHP